MTSIHTTHESLEDWEKVTAWPRFSVTDFWETYINDSMGIKIKYPKEQILVHREEDDAVIFTTLNWKDFPNYPPISLQVLWRGESGNDPLNKLEAEIPGNKAIVPTTINNSRGYRWVDSYPRAGYDLYLQRNDGRGNVVRVFTHDDNPNTNLEERKANLRLFNIMVSTFEYL